jgi:hypothetical protein
MRQRSHTYALLPEALKIGPDMGQVGGVAHLRGRVGQRRGADAVVTNARDGDLQVGDRRAAAVQ